MAMPPVRLHMREMHPIEDGELSYTIQLKRLKSGKLVWIWEVRKTFTGSILDRGRLKGRRRRLHPCQGVGVGPTFAALEEGVDLAPLGGRVPLERVADDAHLRRQHVA
jgi:hypothetical protein